MKYRKKPVVIEAELLEYTTDCRDRIIVWCGGRKALDGSIIISTLEGDMRADTGDYIIKGVNGEFYPCKSDIFEKTYKPVSEAEVQKIKDAIDAIQSNYPPEHYSMLREGLDLAIKLLKEQLPAESEEK